MKPDPSRPPRTLPGFLREETGLGDILKKMTSAVGLRPCGSCLRRAETLNRWVVFRPLR